MNDLAVNPHGSYREKFHKRSRLQCLEVRFTWKNVHHYRPVPLAVVREFWKARPMNVALDKLVIKNRRIRFDEVRTEGKLLASLLRGWALIAP
jgi:hypothetical protein